MLRILFSISMWALLATLVRADQPNIVLILADDLGYETVGCYGGQSYATPNLDKLAKDGIRFDRAYAMPLCTNTRIQLMTGIYNYRNWTSFGILDPNAETFAHLLRREGYKTCMAGKWQLTSYDPPDYPGAEKRRDTGMKVADAGFDAYSLWHTGHTEDKGPRYADPVINENGKLRTDTKGKYGPDLWTNFIGEFMKQHQDEPFFVYYSMALPHNPMNPTPDSPEWKDPNMRHEDITRFAKDMTEYTDKMVGKIRGQVEELGLSEKTLILFVSDNGTNLRVRSKFRDREVGGEKGKATELGCRVPMMALWPETIEPGQVTDALIDSVDFLPTLLEVADAFKRPRDKLDGISFAHLLLGDKKRRGRKPMLRENVLIHQDPRPGWDKDRFGLERVAIGARFKLYEDGRLFDLDDDFFEQHPIWPAADDGASRGGRHALEKFFAEQADFKNFNPAEVPRPDPNAAFAKHAFQTQDAGNFVIVEAEQLPFPRDESWQTERHAKDYTGTGYLRCIREQTADPRDDQGASQVLLSVENSGMFHAAIRLRSDSTSEANPTVRFRHIDSPSWVTIQCKAGTEVGTWQWCDVGQFQLNERSNYFEIAPGSRNVKVDRIVFYREQAKEKALDLNTPCSEYHAWAKQ